MSREHEPARNRNGTSRTPRPARARRHGHSVRFGDRERDRDISGTGRKDYGIRRPPNSLAFVERIPRAPSLACVDFRRTEPSLELEERTLDGRF